MIWLLAYLSLCCVALDYMRGKEGLVGDEDYYGRVEERDEVNA